MSRRASNHTSHTTMRGETISMWALYQLCRGVSYIYLMWSKEFPEIRNSKPDVQHSEIGTPMELLPSFQWHTGSFEDTSLPLLWARLKHVETIQ